MSQSHLAYSVFFVHLTVSSVANDVLHVHSLNLPRIPIRQPKVRVLDLPAILDPLLKHPIVVANSVAPCYPSYSSDTLTIDVHRRKTVHETSSETSKSSVSQSRILVVVVQVFQLISHFLKRLLVGIF